MNNIYIAVLSLLLIGTFTQAQTQNHNEERQYITKYDTTFQGIGPELYFLPPPRSKEEILIDAYSQKVPFVDSIQLELQFQDLIRDFRAYEAFPVPGSLLPDDLLDTTKWAEVLNNPNIKYNYSLYVPLLAESAKAYLQNRDICRAIEVLHEALSIQELMENPFDSHEILSNLVHLYHFDGDIDQARYWLNSYYNHSIKKKSTIQQGYAHTLEALIKASQANYNDAENTIIRKAVPLFNRARSIKGKIWAWEKLAKVYQMQDKHAEAQWFLLQARELAEKNNLIEQLAEIEYMLAVSKLLQENYSVAEKEFLNAQVLAQEEQNKILELAITDKLGDIYLLLGQFDEAQSLLNNYWSLRTEIFDKF